ncbi:conserved exported hypothetical protein [Candidatus Sulfopaludibacter sp. SbA3]|nr:conserved exported hypothetical protein [Candidatus Sulfopaludibacter sp. SbA3]
MKKSFILVGSLALFSLIASAKTYEIALASPALAGKVQLNAGNYRVKVEGGNATFTDENTDKAITVPVKVEQAPKKFEQTAVDTTKENGADHIQAIELGGSTNKLEFGE